MASNNSTVSPDAVQNKTDTSEFGDAGTETVVPDPEAIATDLRWRLTLGLHVEIRALRKTPGSNDAEARHYWLAAGDTESVDRAVAWIIERQAEGFNVYATFNRIEAPPSGSATDADVSRRVRLFLDCDPVRPTKTSATDEQRAAAVAVAANVVGWVTDR